MENLFDNPTTLRNLAHFAGRRDLLERIFGLLKTRQSVSLVGPRRIGKTSLVNCLRSPFWQQQCAFDGEHFLFFYLDLQKLSLKKNVDFFDEVYQIINTYAHAEGYGATGTLDKDDELNMLLARIHERGLYPVLIIDTFDELIQYKELHNKQISHTIFSFLRSLGTGGNLSYVIASVEILSDVFRQLFPEAAKPSPFPNIFATVRLSSLRLAEAQAMLAQTSAQSGLPFTDDENQWIIDLVGTHPFLLQQVATLLFEQKRFFKPEEIDREAIQREVQQNLRGHFEDCYNSLAPKKQKTLLENARRRAQSVENRRQTPDTNGEAASQEAGESQESWDSHIYPEMCRNELFLEYLRESGMLETCPPELKDALEHFDNPSVLGECALIELLPFIEIRMQQQNASSNTTRGRVLQSILSEALDQMRGQGKHSNTARDWGYYNLMYYRYFHKLDLTLDGVASLLNVSSRQYYRLFPKAVEQLWKELQNMDAAQALAVPITAVSKPGD